MDIEQSIFRNIEWIDGQALLIFEKVFGRKVEEESKALGHAFSALLNECSVALGGPRILECSLHSVEGEMRAKALIEAGNRAKAAKQMILNDLSVVSICSTAATKALAAGDLVEAINSTVTASRAIGIAEADLRQLRLAQHKTGKGGRKTQDANRRNADRAAEKVLAAYRAMNPKPREAARAAEKLVQGDIGVPYRRVYDLIRAERKSEKAKLSLQSTE
ncbi:hypothetical protein [Paraburkholderia jirisanensis]